jgi:hypothetical protein
VVDILIVLAKKAQQLVGDTVIVLVGTMDTQQLVGDTVIVLVGTMDTQQWAAVLSIRHVRAIQQ